MPTKSTVESAKRTKAKKTPAGSAGPRKPAAAQSAAPAKTKPPEGRRKAPAGKTAAATYTKPELREQLKEKITAGDKGGRPGQWSARKAQLLASEYEKLGGGYKKASRTSEQKHLESWTAEKWQTADGKKAARGATTARYLPREAWDKLTPAQQKATDEKKKASSRTGHQFVPNTTAAKKARKKTQQS